MDDIQDEIATLQKGVQEKEDAKRKMESRIQDLEHIAKKLKKCHGNNIEEAMYLLECKYMNLEEVMERFDGLATQIEFWEAFLKAINNIPSYVIGKHVAKCFQSTPSTCTRDWEIYMDLAKYDPCLFLKSLKNGGLTGAQLAQIVHAHAGRYPLHFLAVARSLENYNFHEHFPHVFVAILEQLPVYDLSVQHWLHKEALPTSQAFWSNREVAIAWGNAGGPFLTDKFPAEFKNDEEVVSACLGNAGGGICRSVVQLSDELRADKDFMLKTVRSDPSYLAQIADKLVGDMDLLFVALSNDLSWYKDLGHMRWLENGEAEEFFWMRVANAIRERLNRYNVFVKVVLPGMTLPTNSLPLSTLNQGSDMLKVYPKEIAEYLDIPLGKNLATLRAASKTLSLNGYYTWDD